MHCLVKELIRLAKKLAKVIINNRRKLLNRFTAQKRNSTNEHLNSLRHCWFRFSSCRSAFKDAFRTEVNWTKLNWVSSVHSFAINRA